MELITEISTLIKTVINEVGTIMVTMIGVLGIVKLFIGQCKELRNK